MHVCQLSFIILHLPNQYAFCICRQPCDSPQPFLLPNRPPFPAIHAKRARYAVTCRKTRSIDDDLNPDFNEEFYCPVAHITDGIKFKVKDKDLVHDESLGKYFLPVGELLRTVDENDWDGQDESVEVDWTGAKDSHGTNMQQLQPGDLKRVGVHKVVYLDGKKEYGTLEFFVEFIPVQMLSRAMEVPGLYFSATKGNDVRFYMNADDDGSAPLVRYGGAYSGEDGREEKVWKPPRLWRDIYDAICHARHFIYMAGWSFDVDQYLLRGEELKRVQQNSKYSPQLGELLKQKSEEGVIVNLMQWDDYSSNFAFPGMMGTYDEKSRLFFKHTKVHSMFMQTVGGETNTMLEGQNKKMAFTHHQKFIVLDSPREGDEEGVELLAFVGGIDLTEGRWDNRKVCGFFLELRYFLCRWSN